MSECPIAGCSYSHVVGTTRITKAQARVLNYVEHHIEFERIPPTIRQICEALGLTSPSTVHTHLTHLEQMGYIARRGAKRQWIEVLEKND